MAKSDILKEFKKEELMQICDDLNIEYRISDMVRVIIDKIAQDLDVNGLPDPLDEGTSELLFNFMYFAGYINEKGEILNTSSQEVKEVVNTEEKTENPPCWGFRDDRDPSCKRCTVKAGCLQEKLNTKLPCYGKLFSNDDDNCQLCLLASYCKVEIQN